MKKKIYSIALALIAATGIGAMAQKPATCPANASCPTAQKVDNCCMELFMEGITLTPEQQTKIAAIKESRTKKAKEMREARKAEMKDRSQAREQNAAQRKLMRRAHLDEMKSVLTPEQYVVFLENMAINAPSPRMGRNHQAIAQGRHKGNHHRDMKACSAERQANVKKADNTK